MLLVVGHWLYLDENNYCKEHLRCQALIYFKRIGLITNDQLHALHVNPKEPNDWTDIIEVGEGATMVPLVGPIAESSRASSSIDTAVMHTDFGSNHVSLGFYIYGDNSSSGYRAS
jgi:hypothetical protein